MAMTALFRLRSIAAMLFALTAAAVYGNDEASDLTFAKYARYGADVWARNPMAQISGEGEACISCHTSLPYALVEPLLPGDYPAYDNMLRNIDNRIRTWDDNTAWYADDKLEQTAIAGGMPPDALKAFLNARESRGVEAVFNALIRGMHDAYAGAAATSVTRLAFENMWEEQNRIGTEAGRWGWIRANLVPWEVGDSGIWGASLACVAASLYPALAPEDHFAMLGRSLEQAFSDPSVSLHTKAAVLWCDAEWHGQILADQAADAVAARLLAAQRKDGGWALRDLGPWPDWEGSGSDCCQNRDTRSDTYATGFALLALLRNRHRLEAEHAVRLDKAVEWIDRQLGNPYPAGPRYNTHGSSDTEMPEFRDNLYANAGAMWSYVAKKTYELERAPWGDD